MFKRDKIYHAFAGLVILGIALLLNYPHLGIFAVWIAAIAKEVYDARKNKAEVLDFVFTVVPATILYAIVI